MQATVRCGRPVSVDWRRTIPLARGLKVLGHTIRLSILSILSRAGRSVRVCELEANLPVKQPTVSHHLRLLREAGLIEGERWGEKLFAGLWTTVRMGQKVRHHLQDGVALGSGTENARAVGTILVQEPEPKKDGIVALYARVSSSNQKTDLERRGFR